MNTTRALSFITIIFAGVILTPAFSQGPSFYPFFKPHHPERSLQVMSHRGTTSAAPENSVPAFEYAVRNGFEWIEIDVRLSADGVHVVWHDSSMNKAGKPDVSIKETNWNELSSIDIGAWYAPRFAGNKLQSLPDALNWAEGKINLYLDCKDIDPNQIVKDIVSANMQNQVAVYSSPDMLMKVYQQSNGGIPLMAKCHTVDELKELVETIHVAIIEVNPEDLTRELVDAAHQHGVYVQVKSLGEEDNPKLWQKTKKLNVDFIQTGRAESVQALVFNQTIKGPRCWISAHRGASRLAPENTRAAIQAAVDLGCELIEVDVRQTADGKFALLHDSHLDRTTDATGPMRDLTLEALQQLNAGKWFGRNYNGEKILTLEDALKIVKGKARIYLDNKETQPQALVDELHRLGVVDDVVIYGAVEELAMLKKIESRLHLMPPLGSIDQIEMIANRLKPYAFDVRWSALSPELIHASHQAGVKVFSDAMDHESQEEYRKAISWGIDLIQTDYPTFVQRAIEAKQ